MKLILIIALLGLTSCTHSILAKDCKPVQDDQKFVCKSVLPWQ